MADRSRLRRQISRILDESTAATVSVIVQSMPGHLSRAIEMAALEVSGGRSLTSAEPMLPPVVGMRSGRSSAIGRGGRAARAAAPDRVVIERGPPIDVLASSSAFSSNRSARRGDALSRPRQLTVLGAAVVDLLRDDVAALPDKLPPQVSVFPNRWISVPPRMRSVAPSHEVTRRSQFAWGLEKCGALSCWGAFGARGQGVKIAVLDTGVQAKHPDLVGRVSHYVEFDKHGRSVASGVEAARDPDGHGTHVCGTLVGQRASGRWIGMAPDATVHVAKVLGPTGGTDEQILRGLEWAIAERVDVVNMSLGGLSFDAGVMDTYTAAIAAARAAGIPVVAAIGNDGSQTSGSPGNDAFAFAVGATDFNDRIAAFSGGRTQAVYESDVIDRKHLPLIYSKPDLCAPGVDIYSCNGARGWEYANGSSMAAPHVTGAMALLLSRHDPAGECEIHRLVGGDRVAALQQLLIGSVKELGENGQDHRYGWGRLDVSAAYTAAIDRGYRPPA